MDLVEQKVVLKNNEHDKLFMFSYASLRKCSVPLIFFFLVLYEALWYKLKLSRFSSCTQWSLCGSLLTWSILWFYNGNAKLGSCWNAWELSDDVGFWISIWFNLKWYLLKGLETWPIPNSTEEMATFFLFYSFSVSSVLALLAVNYCLLVRQLFTNVHE